MNLEFSAEIDLRFVVYVMFGLGGSQVESVVAVLSRYEDNVQWISKYYGGLKNKFKDEWVAVLNKAVIGHDRDWLGLLKD